MSNNPDRYGQIGNEDKGIEVGNPADPVRLRTRRSTFGISVILVVAVTRGGSRVRMIVGLVRGSSRDDRAADVNVVVVMPDQVDRRDDDERAGGQAHEQQRNVF